MRRLPERSLWYLTALTLLALQLGCATVPHADSQRDVAALLARDQAFSDDCVAHGMAASFGAVLADDGVSVGNGHVTAGKTALMAVYEKNKDLHLSWVPDMADASGDLGYTRGHYTAVSPGKDGKPETSTGVYVTIWKRRSDGVWRMVLDTGSEKPAL